MTFTRGLWLGAFGVAILALTTQYPLVDPTPQGVIRQGQWRSLLGDDVETRVGKIPLTSGTMQIVPAPEEDACRYREDAAFIGGSCGVLALGVVGSGPGRRLTDGDTATLWIDPHGALKVSLVDGSSGLSLHDDHDQSWLLAFLVMHVCSLAVLAVVMVTMARRRAA